MTTQTTRRALIGGAGLALVTGGLAITSQAKGAEAPVVDRTAWDRAFKSMLDATAEDEAINARYEGADAAGREALEDEYERLGEVRYEATWALMDVPAPDNAAFLWKTEYLFGDTIPEGGGSASWAPEVIVPYMADCRRLLGSEAR
jgi:hypothetical protein